MPKDLFSTQSDSYAKYRPTYPQELFAYILGFVKERKCAWDCATGNGQAANVLADYFERIEATDISEAQLKNAVRKDNIHYQICPAEQTPFAADSFDLITVATAYHWFDWDKFRKEAFRVGRQNCVVAAWAYNLVVCSHGSINKIIHDFYFNTVYAYWDKERRYVEQSYKTVDFSFAPLPSQDFTILRLWTKEDLLGYIATWSALQNYQQRHGSSPLPELQQKLYAVWPGNEEKQFQFPLFLRLGKVLK